MGDLEEISLEELRVRAAENPGTVPVGALVEDVTSDCWYQPSNSLLMNLGFSIVKGSGRPAGNVRSDLDYLGLSRDRPAELFVVLPDGWKTKHIGRNTAFYNSLGELKFYSYRKIDPETGEIESVIKLPTKD